MSNPNNAPGWASSVSTGTIIKEAHRVSLIVNLEATGYDDRQLRIALHNAISACGRAVAEVSALTEQQIAEKIEYLDRLDAHVKKIDPITLKPKIQ